MKKKEMKKRINELEAERLELFKDIDILLSNDFVSSINVRLRHNTRKQIDALIWSGHTKQLES